MTIQNEFAHHLYVCRNQKGLSQAEVAESANLSVRHYQELEIGRANPLLSTAIRLAETLGISLDALKNSL